MVEKVNKRKEYMKDYMRKKRMEARQEPEYTWVDKDMMLFQTHGRGVPVEIDGQYYVLISRAQDTYGAVTKEDWEARLDYECKHGRQGWSCKICLKD